MLPTAATRTPAQDHAETLRAIGKPGERLDDLRPDVVARAISNITRPAIAPGLLRINSNHRVLFLCQCGESFESFVWNAVRLTVLCCRTCRRTGKSRLEFEVAALVGALTGYEVQLHYALAGRLEVDLYLPDLGFGIDLDPHSSHSKRESADRSVGGKKAALCRQYVRLREAPLTLWVGCAGVPSKTTARAWAELAAQLVTNGDTLRALSFSEEIEILTEASVQWDDSLRQKPTPSLADHPLSTEFVRNITHPGRRTEWIPQGGGDRCLWHCGQCGHEWESTVGHRVGSSTGCPTCAVVRRTATRQHAQFSESAASRSPRLLTEFVRNITRPEADLSSTYPRSTDRCLWRCSECGEEWEASVASRDVSKYQGCRSCVYTRVWATGERDVSHHEARWDRSFDALVAFQHTNGSTIVPEGTVHDGIALGDWVFSQRKRRFDMSATRQLRLDAIPGWSWDRTADRWALGFDHLTAYFEREGHAAPKYRHLENGYRLGVWVVNQRAARSRLTKTQLTALEALGGWDWSPSRGRRTDTQEPSITE